jgi:hypothetical protein
MLNSEELARLREELKLVKGRVDWILQNYPSSRNSDFILTLIYYRQFHSLPFPYLEYEAIKELPTMESIRRVRQKIQNEEHRWLPTDETVIRRRSKQSAMRRWAVEDRE